MFTREDFQATADILRTQIRETQILIDGKVIPGLVAPGHQKTHDVLREMMYEFANMFAESNPRFDRDTFIRACFTD